MPINIEITDSPDTALLAQLHTACFEKGWDAEAMKGLLSIKHTFAFITPDAKGFALLRLIGDEAEILTLAVIHHARKQGLGSALIQSMKGWGIKHGAKTIFLEVSEKNREAYELYEKMGFSRLSKRLNYYHNTDGSREDAIVMQFKA